MELHGGSVSVLSDGEGTGCTFTMDIPIVQTHASSNHIPKSTRIRLEAFSIDDEGAKVCSRIQSASLTNINSEDDLTCIDITSSHGTVADQKSCHQVDISKRCNFQKMYLATSSLSVLIVDDSGPNRKMLSRLISSSFGKVSLAVDGLDALRFVRETHQKPEIILMDYVMPNMDGPTATKELRALGYKGMIIGVTGNALPAEIDTFLDHGATCVLTKPLRLKELFAAVSGTGKFSGYVSI